MALTAEQQQILSSLLSAEMVSSEHLREILGQEHQALISKEPDEITAIVKRKQQLLVELHRHSQKRDQLLRYCSLQPGRAGMEQLIDGLPAESQLARQWHELYQLAGVLRDQNEINGGIVTLGQRQARQALDILSGRVSNGNTYGPSGERRELPYSKPLAKA